jgi:hypothetical protein
VTDEVIMEYIKSQDDGAETNDEFSIIGD